MRVKGYLPELKTIISRCAVIVEFGVILPALEAKCNH